MEAVRRDIPVILKNMLVRAASRSSSDRLPVRANRDYNAGGGKPAPRDR
ncbi:hypothetical protein [Streptomyces somaliensis]|nr:hypothetical protein [Streptomyces somaliensis]